MKMLKLRYIIFSVAIISFSLSAQIPNAGFENWTAGTPNNWITTNIPGFATPITQSTEAHSGSYAAKGSVVTVTGVPVPMTAQMYTGTPGSGFPVNTRPKSFTMWYKFTSVSEDISYYQVILLKDTTVVASAANFMTPTTSYSKISMDFIYVSPVVPNNGYVQLGIGPKQSGSVAHQGSFYIVDDLAMEGTATDVKTDNAIPASFELKQNFPNPFNPSTDIEYSVPFKSNVKISVFNLIGQKVADILNEVKEAGSYKAHFNAGNLTSGVYFYKLEAGSFVSTKKMILTK